MTDALFGQIITAVDVETAMLDHLENWMETYIAKVERDAGLDPRSIGLPRSYSNNNEFNKRTEAQTPAIVVISPGMASDGVMRHAGEYTTRWVAGVGVVTLARDQASTSRLAKLYAAAIRGIVLQHKGLGGFAVSTDWVAPFESYTDVRFSQTRTLGTARLFFEVEVKETVDSSKGPRAPLQNPYNIPSTTDFTTVETTVEKEPIT